MTQTVYSKPEFLGINWRSQRGRWLEVGIVGAIALLLVVVMPLVLPGFRLNLLGRFLALAIAALGIDLIWGFTGLLSLGHGVFFALGGYAFAMYLKLQNPTGSGPQIPDFMSLYGGATELPWLWQPFQSLPLTLLAIVVLPALVAAALGYFVFRNRIRGVYFSILTQAVTIIFLNLFNGQQQLINGANGLTDFKTIFGLPISEPSTQRGFYIVTVVTLAGAYALCRWLTSGRFGRLLVAIRDDESRVRFSGYNPTGFKLLVFAVSAALAGVSGALYTPQTGIVTPGALSIAFSIEMVIWVAVGGRATLVGAILGALLVNFAKSLLSERFEEVWLFFQGGLFLVVVMALPQGIVGWLRTDGLQGLQGLLGLRPRVMTYPSLETDPEVELERQQLGSED
ncbi:urea ABC transporter permease subunit UrtC [Geitlerinema sp. PCC 7407]|uniref:urea ABC transporter permease subunit UrtC n=1 Tax=Geitlerinema sp. PCC 7407 TaxID=1173025 RepID=UPI00029FF9F5|nr:urea ABC transporter permease subunit UrtC [Geitlerinema sp. PCC 7407]AFY65955.1 urea ABC transporter membrane protein [Geitlerinema sp. PCC 7407]